MRKALALPLATSLALFACESSTPAPKTPEPASSSSVASATSAPPPASAEPGSANEPPPNGNGAVKAPVFSEDDCTKDSECAAQKTCHPDKCVKLADVGSMAAGTMCTMDCRGGTLDCGFNHCGCAKNPSGQLKCAMLPGAK